MLDGGLGRGVTRALIERAVVVVLLAMGVAALVLAITTPMTLLQQVMFGLGAFGLARELSGTALLPIGTLYDPFVARGLDALYHALYAGARFIVAATPSGVSLSPEGGAHQSVITPSIGVALPAVRYFEPAFAREVEWIVLDGLERLSDRRGGESLYLRLSTKPVEQSLEGGILQDAHSDLAPESDHGRTATAVEAQRRRRHAEPWRGVSHHCAFPPNARGRVAAALELGEHQAAARRADLPAMGVAAEIRAQPAAAAWSAISAEWTRAIRQPSAR